MSYVLFKDGRVIGRVHPDVRSADAEAKNLGADSVFELNKRREYPRLLTEDQRDELLKDGLTETAEEILFDELPDAKDTIKDKPDREFLYDLMQGRSMLDMTKKLKAADVVGIEGILAIHELEDAE